MNYADIKSVDVANGPGVRVSLFVSGCKHHCDGCFNKETWDFSFGKPFGDKQTLWILELLKPKHIRGLSVLGGEPFDPANQAAVLSLLKRVRAERPDKDVWCYTGYLYEQLRDHKIGEHSRELLEQLDVLVDGPFVLDKKNLSLRFKGSENQRIIKVRPSLITGRLVEWEDGGMANG